MNILQRAMKSFPLRIEFDRAPSGGWPIWLIWGQSFGFVCVLATLFDLAWGGRLSVTSWLAGVGLSFSGGVLLGSGVSFVLLLLRRRPQVVRTSMWFILGAVSAWGLASALGAVENWGGKYHHMALGVWAGSAGLGGLLALLGWSLGPSGDFVPGWLLRKSNLERSLLALLLTVVAAVALWVDRTQFPGGYPVAHLTLQVTTLACLSVSWVVSGLQFRLNPGPAGWLIVLVLALLVLAPWGLLQSPDSRVVQEIVSRPFSAFHLKMGRALTDFDGDSYSSYLAGGDCAPFDSSVNPEQLEIPNNGLDDNCMMGDATGLASIAEDVAIPEQPSPLSVVLITVDTLRPDHMSAYGYERQTTPIIANWAEGATRFSSAYTSGGWTSLAIPSMMFGTYPRRLKWASMVETKKGQYLPAVRLNELGAGDEVRARFMLPLDDPRSPLAFYLQRRGMYTTAVTDSGFTKILAPEWGFGKGFDKYFEVGSLPRRRRNDRSTARAAWKALEERPKDHSFFMWVHFFGPHAPSVVHRRLKKFGTDIVAKYDQELLYLDTHLGWLLEKMDNMEGTAPAVILTSDHGERFYSGKSRGHGGDLSAASIRIPLIVKAPGFPGGDNPVPVSLVDVMPTVFGLTETLGPSDLDGIDLAPIARGESQQEDRILFVESFYHDKTGKKFRKDYVGAISGEHRLIRGRVKGSITLHKRGDTNYPEKDLYKKGREPRIEEALDRYIENAGGPPTVSGLPPTEK